jgi:hypothetical protein
MAETLLKAPSLWIPGTRKIYQASNWLLVDETSNEAGNGRKIIDAMQTEADESEISQSQNSSGATRPEQR